MLYLASASPRRRELLEKAGIEYTLVEQNADENLAEEILPADAVLLLAERKCLAGAERVSPSDAVLGADTLVAVSQTVENKDVDRPDNERQHEDKAVQ